MPSPQADADAAADEELRGLARLATDAELVSAVLARLDERDPGELEARRKVARRLIAAAAA